MKATGEERRGARRSPSAVYADVWTRHGLLAVAAAAALIALAILGARLASPVSAAVSPTYLGAFGPDGTENSYFEKVGPVGVDQETGDVYVGDISKQALYKFDADGKPVAWGGTANYITENEISELSFDANPTIDEVAVDSRTHVIYVSSGNKIRAFEANGEPHNFTAGPGANTSEIPGATTLSGLAVDRYGAIYAADYQSEAIRIYAPTGELITEINPVHNEFSSPLTPRGLAVSGDGALYVADNTITQRLYKLQPTEFPVTSATEYGKGQVVGDETAAAVAVDPTTNFVYVSTSKPAIEVFDENDQMIGRLGEREEVGNSPQFVAYVGLAAGGGHERLYAAAYDYEGPELTNQIKTFETFTFPVGPPSIEGTGVFELSSTTATLHGWVNPNTLATAYRFEYGTANCQLDAACTSVPVGGEAIGAGHNPVSVSVDLSGLSPSTTYYYRLVATNSADTTAGPLRTFKTQVGAVGFRAMDSRSWEQVTPINKFGGVVLNKSGVVRAAADGSGVVFPTRGSIVAEPEGNRVLELATALARRDSAGWGAEDLTPPHTEASGISFEPEYKLFSYDLGRAAFEARDDTPLSPEASERTPYLRINSHPRVFKPLVTSKVGYANVPSGTVFGREGNGTREGISLQGANEELSHIALSSDVPLAKDAAKGALYVWVDGALEPVSELPGPEGGIVSARLGSGNLSVRHAVSEDGSRVFWTSEGLYLRDTKAGESVKLDAPEVGADEGGQVDPQFMGANRDGSTVFFTDPQHLTVDADSQGRDLYRCEIGTVESSLGCVELENLSASINGSVEEASLGMSEQGDIVYFVENAADHANLYVWQEGRGVHLITELSSADRPNWGEYGGSGYASRVAAASSPNGRFLTFMSQRSLDDGETRDPVSGDPVEQAYLYDLATDRIACLSCNPTGSTDRGQVLVESKDQSGISIDPMSLWNKYRVGATLVEAAEIQPTDGYAPYHPRGVLDNGRVFFNSPSGLVPADSNGAWDVYQYEPFGVGDCGPGSEGPSVAVLDDACLGLVSAGTDDESSVFLDASTSGDDAFIATFDRLSVLDDDDVADVYDARAGGTAAVAETHPECLGEACQPPPPPTNDPTPASAAFSGPGNVIAKKAKHCRRGQRKVRRKGQVRCVKRRHQAKGKATRRGGR